MNLYKIFQVVNIDYDTYDSAVVAAETEDEARKIQPGCHDSPVTDSKHESCWCRLSDVQCEFIGTAKEGTKAGVIVASFNAG